MGQSTTTCQKVTLNAKGSRWNAAQVLMASSLPNDFDVRAKDERAGLLLASEVRLPSASSCSQYASPELPGDQADRMNQVRDSN